MAHQTPWQANDPSESEKENGSSGKGFRLQSDFRLQPISATLRRNWGYLCAAIGSLVTLYLMFEPWIRTHAHDGSVTVTPFGKMHVSTTLVTLWSGAPRKTAPINGMWAVLATIAGLIVVLSVVALMLKLSGNKRLPARLTVAAALSMAVFTVATAVHMNSKLADVRKIVSAGTHRDLGTQVGMLIRWASGNGSYRVPGLHKVTYTTASLSAVAWYAIAAALIAAVAATLQWAQENGSAGRVLPWRVSVAKAGEGPPRPTEDTPKPSAPEESS